MKTKINENKLFFLIFFAIVAFLFYKVISPYLALIALALVTVVIFNPLYTLYLKLFRNHTGITTAITVITILLIFIVPLVLIVNMTAQQTITFYKDLKNSLEGYTFSVADIVDRINSLLSKISYIKYRITEAQFEKSLIDLINPLKDFIINNTLNIGLQVAGAIPKITIYIILLLALFPNHTKLRSFVKSISPMDDEINEMYIKRVVAMLKSTIKGSFIIAIVQALISAFVLYLVGVKYTAFWILLLTFLSIIPLGAGIVTVPIGFIMILTGNFWKGAFIIVNHFLVVTNIDNFLRIKLTPKDGRLPPVLLLLGILGGVSVFGLIGVIYGPVIMILFVTTLEVYIKHYKS